MSWLQAADGGTGAVGPRTGNGNPNRPAESGLGRDRGRQMRKLGITFIDFAPGGLSPTPG